jgi:hypothetical protein
VAEGEGEGEEDGVAPHRSLWLLPCGAERGVGPQGLLGGAMGRVATLGLEGAVVDAGRHQRGHHALWCARQPQPLPSTR